MRKGKKQMLLLFCCLNWMFFSRNLLLPVYFFHNHFFACFVLFPSLSFLNLVKIEREPCAPSAQLNDQVISYEVQLKVVLSLFISLLSLLHFPLFFFSLFNFRTVFLFFFRTTERDPRIGN